MDKLSEAQVVSLFAGVRGYLDKIATKDIPRFEQLWLEYIRGSKPEILAKVRAHHINSNIVFF